MSEDTHWCDDCDCERVFVELEDGRCECQVCGGTV